MPTIPSYTQTFGGSTIQPADVSYKQYSLSANLVLNWPSSFQDTANITAHIVEVNATAPALTVKMPSALEVSVGQDILFNNIGSNAFQVLDNAGGALITINPGVSQYLYLYDNTTAAGLWRILTLGGGSGGGTVTSVGIISDTPATLTVVSGSPVTGSGNIHLSVTNGGGGGGTVTSVGLNSLTPDIVVTVDTTNPITTSGTFSLNLGADLNQIINVGNGIVVHTGPGTWTNRSIIGDQNITIVNGNGIAANPQVTLNLNLINLVSASIGNLFLSGNTLANSASNQSINLFPNGTGAVQIANGSPLRFFNAANTFYDGFVAPTLAQNNTWTLPLTDGVANSFLSTDGSGTLSFQTVPSIYPSIVGKNLLRNGNFVLWQRGPTATVTNANVYVADRWNCASGAGTQATFSQQGFVVRGGSYLQDANGNPILQAQRVASNAGTGLIQVAQSLDNNDWSFFIGSPLTLTFQAECGANFSAASSQIFVKVVVGTGQSIFSVIGTGFTSPTNILNTTATLTTSFQQFSFTTSVIPNNATQLAVVFGYTPVGTAGANDWFAIKTCKLEVGNNFTGYEYRKFWADEDSLCWPFFTSTFLTNFKPTQNSNNLFVPPSGVSDSTYFQVTSANRASTGRNVVQVFFNEPMFAAIGLSFSRITIYNTNNTNGNIYDRDVGGDCSGPTFLYINESGFAFTCTGNAGTSVGNILSFAWAADGEMY